MRATYAPPAIRSDPSSRPWDRCRLGCQTRLPRDEQIQAFIEHFCGKLDEILSELQGESQAEWRERNERLALESVRPGGQTSLLQLVRRDPRYLATDAVIARLISARLDMVGPGLASRLYPELQASFQAIKEQAKDFLDDLGGAVSCSIGTGKGRRAPDTGLLLAAADVMLESLFRLYDSEPEARLGQPDRRRMALDTTRMRELALEYHLPDDAVIAFFEAVVSPSGRGFSKPLQIGLAARYGIGEDTVVKALGDRASIWIAEHRK